MWNGRIAKSWSKAWEKHKREKQLRKSVRTWTEEVITKILELNHHMWITRNGILHGKDEDGLPIDEGIQLREDLEEQLHLGPEGLLQEDAAAFPRSWGTIREWTTAHKKAWLRDIRVAREHAEREEESTTATMRNNMASWLQEKTQLRADFNGPPRGSGGASHAERSASCASAGLYCSTYWT